MNKRTLSRLQSRLVAATLWAGSVGILRATTVVRTINVILRRPA